MKNKPLAAADINKLLAQALEMIIMMLFNMCLRPSQASLAIGYGPWRGLGHTSIYKTEEILAVLIHIDHGYGKLDALVTDLKNACDKAGAPAHDPRQLLIRTPALIPYFYAMAAIENWDFKTELVNRTGEGIPALPEKNEFQDMPTKGLVYQPPRVDLAVEAQLGKHLSNPGNMTDWRLYTGIMGLRFFAGMAEANRVAITTGVKISGFSYSRFMVEKKEREDREEERSKRETERSKKKNENVNKAS